MMIGPYIWLGNSTGMVHAESVMHAAHDHVMITCHMMVVTECVMRMLYDES